MVRQLQSILILALMITTTTAVIGQKKLHKANKQYNLKHYNLAIDTYHEFLVQKPSNLEARTNLADCYRMSNDLVKADNLYAKLVALEHIDPEVIKKYGLTLMKMGKYDQAKYYFQIYKVYDAQDGEHYEMSCDFAKQMFEQQPTHEIELTNVNTPNSDFGVSFYKDKLIFSSFRSDINPLKSSKGQALNGNILYVADLDEDMRATNVRFLRSEISDKENIGPISYNEAGGMVAFARNKIKDGGAHVTGDDSKHSLYIASLTKDGDWKDERSFRYNEFGTSTAFPSLAFNGTALYFSSNRVGGYGGYDIYVSYYKNKEWTYPVNLGPTINTIGNEITPFFDNSNIYFASDYMHGMGGYDIFKSSVSGGKWTYPTNMGNGINSPGDDYYPSIKRSTEMILFSSNRLGGRGMDDIYLAAPIQEEELASAIPPPAVKLSDLTSRTSDVDPSTQSVANTAVTLVEIKEPTTIDTKESRSIASATTIDRRENITPNLVAIPVLKTQSEPIADVEEAELTEKQSLTERKEHTENIEVNGTDQQLAATLEVEKDGSIVEHVTMTEMSPQITEEQSTPVSTEVELADLAPNTITIKEVSQPEMVTESTENNEVSDVTAIPEAYKIPEFKDLSPASAPLNIDYSSAKRVAIDEILPAAEVYFIQLAALYSSKGDVGQYMDLKRFGNLYKVYKSSSTKIKLGYFLDKAEATNILHQVKANGYQDAFITKDVLNSSELELIVASDAQSSFDSYTSTPSYNDSKSVKSYKIRLASYEDPIWFDIETAKNLGHIEQWTKGGWTIFILSGFDNYETAEAARIRAVNMGFADAEVVIDNNGILERLRMH